MARSRDPQRLDLLVRAATEVFIAQGYRRTQMMDIAEVAQVAKGTLYLYVESKEALFDLAVRHADSSEPISIPDRLPIRTPPAESTARFVSEELGRKSSLPTLGACLAKKRITDPSGELETIVVELFDLLHDNRVGLKLIDRCASDFPGLASIYHHVARDGVPEVLASYIESRIERRHFRPWTDVRVAARSVIETITFWAVHVHWDRSPAPYDPDAVRQTVVEMVKATLVRDHRPTS